MKIFLDTNVIIDRIIEREGSYLANALFSYYNSGSDRLYASFLSVANTAYILRKTHTPLKLHDLIKDFLSECCILPMNDMQIYNALTCKSPDFEDSLQIMCAEQKECDVILTNNVTHFRGFTDIPVLTPAEFLSHASSTPARL